MTTLSPPCHQGTLYGLSLGPGDPGLITRRAWEILQTDAIWAYPVRRQGEESYALGIVQRAGLPVPASAMALAFPMTSDTETLARHWLEAAQRVLAQLTAGRDVCFLVEGDASTYSTFGHLARTVTALAAETRIETIAGVSSWQAAAARLVLPLAEVEERIAILPATYGVAQIETMLDHCDTLVLIKVSPVLDKLIALLERRGLLAGARFIEKAGAPEERVVEDVASLRGEKVNYLSLMLVKINR